MRRARGLAAGDRARGGPARAALAGGAARAAAPLARRARNGRPQPARTPAWPACRDAVVLRPARPAGGERVSPSRPFRRRGDAQRIEQVCGDGIDDVLESLAQLVDTSLVRRTRDGRFEVASALRTYSRELLEASGEADALCRRHAEAVVAEWLPVVIERPMVAFRETFGPIV